MQSDQLKGMYISQMNGKDFEVDKDVEKDKRIDPKTVFQNYSDKASLANKKQKQKKKEKKKKVDKPQPVYEEKKTGGKKYGM